MLDLFKKTLMVCAAIGTFGSGAFVAGTWIDGALTQKVKAVTSAEPSLAEGVLDVVKDVVGKRR